MAEVQEHRDLMGKLNDDGFVENHLEKLRAISGSLRFVGILTFLLTLVNIGLIVYMLFLISRTEGTSNSIISPLWMSGISFAFIISVLVSVLVFERMRKRGNTLFEEISDEMQKQVADLRVAPKPSQADELPQERSLLKAREALRSYVQTTDLPIIPGKMGPALYVVFNLTFFTLLTIGLPGTPQPEIFPEPATLSIYYPIAFYDISQSERDSLKSFFEQIADFSRQEKLNISIHGSAGDTPVSQGARYTGVSIDDASYFVIPGGVEKRISIESGGELNNERLAFLRAYYVKQVLVAFLKDRGVDSSQYDSGLVVDTEGNERKVEVRISYQDN